MSFTLHYNQDAVDNWLIKRHGMFTASKIDLLWASGAAGRLFSPGGAGYIKKKAVEGLTTLFEKPEMEQVKSLLHGKVYEEPAINHYCRTSRNWDINYYGTLEPVFLLYNNDSGGSPDAQSGNKELLVEIKCPYNSEIHFDHLDFKDQFDLKEYNFNNYAQVQFLMMITGAKDAHWVSYDERFMDPSLKMKIVEIKPDIKFQNNLAVRIEMAIKEKYKIINNKKSMAA